MSVSPCLARTLVAPSGGAVVEPVAAVDGLAAHAAGHDGHGGGRVGARGADRPQGGTISCA
jgi:hypothetical protein